MTLKPGMHLGLLLLLLVNALPVIEAEQSWWIFAIATAAAATSFFYIRASKGKRLSRQVLYFAISSATVFLIYEMYFPQQESTVHIVDLAHFILFLSCCKFFELYSLRDVGVVVLIAFLLLVIGAFTSASPLFAFAIAVNLTIGVAWMITFQAQRECDGVIARRRAAMANAGEEVHIIFPEHELQSHKSALAPTLLCSGLLLGIAALVFVSVPRAWGRGLFGRMHGLVPMTVTGFAEGVQLTSEDVLEDDTPMMRVRFERNGKQLTDNDIFPYMRGLTFSHYENGQWGRSPTIIQREVILGRHAKTSYISEIELDLPSPALIKQEVWLESSVSGLIFAMYPPLAIASDDDIQVGIDRRDMVIRCGRANARKVHYVIFSAEQLTSSQIDDLSPPPRSRRPIRSMISDRISNFASTLAARIGDAADPDQHEKIADALCSYLSAGEFEYSLRRGPKRSSGDLMEDFLFVNRQGHCEYFASAMTLLCQAVGIRSRMVSGYAGGEYNQVGGFFQFRRMDAHSWVEVYLPQRGWVKYDPTPPSRVRNEKADESFLTQARRVLDVLSFQWSSLVVSFDTQNREAMMNKFVQWLAGIAESRERPKSFSAMLVELLWGPELIPLWQRVFYWLLLVLITAFFVLIFRVLWILYLMFKEYLSGSWRSRTAAARRPEAKFYDRLSLLLAHKGHVKPVHLTPREFAVSLSRTNSDLAPLPELVDWFYEMQYGEGVLSRERRERIQLFLQMLREDASFGAT